MTTFGRTLQKDLENHFQFGLGNSPTCGVCLFYHLFRLVQHHLADKHFKLEELEKLMILLTQISITVGFVSYPVQNH